MITPFGDVVIQLLEKETKLSAEETLSKELVTMLKGNKIMFSDKEIL